MTVHTSYRAVIDARPATAPGFPAWFSEWKRLRAAGWDVTVLVSSDGRRLVGLGCVQAEAQLSLLSGAA